MRDGEFSRPSSAALRVLGMALTGARRWIGERWQLVAIAILGLVVLVLVVAQLVLPGVAEDRVRERVGRYGTVQHVHVHAVPAIALLWGDAQEITVSAGAMQIAARELADLERQLAGVDKAELSTPAMDLGLSTVPAIRVSLERVYLRKRDNVLAAQATVSPAALRALVPPGFTIGRLEANGGQPEAAVSGEFLGVSVSGRAVVSANDGKIVVEPAGLPFAGFASITLFSDPRIYVEDVSATQEGEALRISIRARPAS